MPVMRVEYVRGNPVRIATQEIIPIAKVRRLTWGSRRVEWHRPAAVEVRTGDHVRRVPIHNVTRQVIAGTILAGIVLGILGMWVERIYLRRRRTS